MPTICDALAMSSALRCPRFEKEVPPRVKIQELEDYTLTTAFAQGELSEERLHRLADLELVRRQWEHLDGYHGLRRSKTEAAVQDAKRQVDPDLWERKQELEWQVKRLSEEIDRLEADATKVSRAYTMLTGS